MVPSAQQTFELEDTTPMRVHSLNPALVMSWWMHDGAWMSEMAWKHLKKERCVIERMDRLAPMTESELSFLPRSVNGLSSLCMFVSWCRFDGT